MKKNMINTCWITTSLPDAILKEARQLDEHRKRKAESNWLNFKPRPIIYNDCGEACYGNKYEHECVHSESEPSCARH